MWWVIAAAGWLTAATAGAVVLGRVIARRDCCADGHPEAGAR